MGRNRNKNMVELKTMLVSQYEDYLMDFIYFKCTAIFYVTNMLRYNNKKILI